MINLFSVDRLLSKFTSVIVSLVIVSNPLIVLADAITDGADAGNEFYNSTVQPGYNAPSINSSQGTFTINPGTTEEQVINIQSLFGVEAVGSDTTTMTDTYGNNSGIITMGTTATGELDGGTSITSDAYSIVKRAKDIPPPNLSNDPIFNTAGTSIGNANLLDTFEGCTSTTTVTPSTTTYKTEDIKTCERVIKTGENCNIIHDYYRDPPVITHSCDLNLPFNETKVLHNAAHVDDFVLARAHCNPFVAENEVVIEVYGTDHAVYPDPADCTPWSSFIANTSQVTSTYTGIELRPNWHSSSCSIVPAFYSGECFGNACDYTITYYELTSWDGTQDGDICSGSIVDLAAKGYSGAFGRNGDQFDPNKGKHCAYKTTTVNQVFEKPHTIVTPGAVHDFYANTCVSDLTNLNSFCTVTDSCTDMPTTDGLGCIATGNGDICPDELLDPPYAFIDKVCRDTNIDINCDPITTGTADCFIDVNGVEQCLVIETNAVSNCAPLEGDSNCAFISSTCVEDSVAEDGSCLVFEDVYDCGQNVVVDGNNIETITSCAGAPVRCLDSECANGTGTDSDSFHEAYAYMQVMDMMGLEADCTTGTCEVFTGENLKCLKAVGGVQNCCEHPSSGFGVVDYIKLAYGIGRVDGYIQGLDPASAIRGGWSVVRDPVVDAWNYVAKLWTSPSENIAATSTVGADAAQATMLEGFKQSMMSSMNTFVTNTFGPDAASMFFSTSPTGAVSLSPALGTFFAAVAWIYTFVVMVELITQLLYPCDEESFELAAKKELKSCHYVGSYCAQRTPVGGYCLVKQAVSCCYNSPLGRIVMQEVRKQGYENWGTPRVPNCEGIAINDISTIDWALVDLSEWLAYLDLADQLPDVTSIDVESMTGNGSTSDFAGDDVDRDNVLERTNLRMDGLDYDTITDEALMDIRSGL
jgi:conjugal transfer mating pair stabilization protein TraN